jgi:hypothetical protein
MSNFAECLDYAVQALDTAKRCDAFDRSRWLSISKHWIGLAAEINGAQSKQKAAANADLGTDLRAANDAEALGRRIEPPRGR